MTVPTVRQTAPWPLRKNAPANYDQMADAVGASLPNTIDDINAFGAWMEARAAGTDAAKQAAEQSAAAAADSAAAAAAQAQLATTNGQAQVQEAASQVQAASAQADRAAQEAGRSEDAADQAQLMAAAAQAAAGLPALAGNSGRVLGVKADGTGVEFQSRHAIGQAVIAAVRPDASYIQAGGIYLQAAFPELFALLGKIPTPGVFAFEGVTNNSGYTITDLDGNGAGTWMAAVSYVTGSSVSLAGYLLRSTDNGKTWGVVSVSRLRVSRVRYSSLGQWVAVGMNYDNAKPAYSISDDGGATWSVGVDIPSHAANLDMIDLSVNAAGLVLATGRFYSSTYSAWAAVINPATKASGAAAILVSGGVYVQSSRLGIVFSSAFALCCTSGGVVRKSTVNATTLAIGTAVLKSTGTTQNLNAIDHRSGTYIAVGDAGTVRRSTDEGETWTGSAFPTTAQLIRINPLGSGVWVAADATGALWVSKDDGVSFSASVSLGLSSEAVAMRTAGGVTVAAGGTAMRRSESAYSYDSNTQFLVPAINTGAGSLSAYVKALEAAA